MIFCLWLLPVLLSAQEVDWISFDDLSDSLRNHPKPVMIFITAEWCPYCKLQNKKTFGKSKIVADLRDYYCLQLDVETQEEIRFLNRNYTFESRGIRSGTHQLAKLLGTIDDRLLLPTTVLLDEQLRVVDREKGYIDPVYFRRWLQRAF